MSIRSTFGRARTITLAALLGANALSPSGIARAATGIAPPVISGPPGALSKVGVPVAFTFTAGTGSHPAAFEYQVDGGRLERAKAVAGTASVEITPARRTNYLIVYAVAADGTLSASARQSFLADAASPAATGDLNGDGVPDLLTVGATGALGLGPGLWLATGDANRTGQHPTGHLDIPATDIGINGNGFGSPGSPADFDGAQVITGQFTGDGFQDILAYYPRGQFAGSGLVFCGSGDGSPLVPISGNEWLITAGTLTDANGDNPLQLANAYNSIYNTGEPDLIATDGDPSNGYYLAYFVASVPGGYFYQFRINTLTPDGTTDWNNWTIATTQVASGTAMFLWNQATGALYLWSGVTVTDNGDGVTDSIAYTQFKISAHWNKGATLTTLEAADFDGDGVPDLWTVTPDGVATAYQLSDLSTTSTATIDATHSEKLT